MRFFATAAFAFVLLIPPAVAAQDAPAEVTSYCDHVVACDTTGATTAANCVADVSPLNVVDNVEHPLCDALYAAILARYTCLTSASCETLSDNSACAAESNAVSDAVLAGGHSCFSGHAPVVVPTTWTCNRFYYAGGDSDGCDCGCGAVDPDCDDGGGCGEPGCFEEQCEFCYLDGTDVPCDDGRPSGEGEGELPSGIAPKETPKPESSCQSTSTIAAPVALLLAALRRHRRRAHRSINN